MRKWSDPDPGSRNRDKTFRIRNTAQGYEVTNKPYLYSDTQNLSPSSSYVTGKERPVLLGACGQNKILFIQGHTHSQPGSKEVWCKNRLYVGTHMRLLRKSFLFSDTQVLSPGSRDVPRCQLAGKEMACPQGHEDTTGRRTCKCKNDRRLRNNLWK
jgi:hypothetical protein